MVSRLAAVPSRSRAQSIVCASDCVRSRAAAVETGAVFAGMMPGIQVLPPTNACTGKIAGAIVDAV